MTTALEKDSVRLLEEALGALDKGFAALPPVQPAQHGADAAAMARVLGEVAERMLDNFPYFHPLYAGQMLKPPHPVARAASALAAWINPNNHALDGGRASSRMEKEAGPPPAPLFGRETPPGPPFCART